ncbi:hypothetical protein BN85404610 [Alteracholeplasma palmae J233]|uniref:LemA family protein n=1 Tax=Alteracholeplasma palmae (strain ATCC 49389 / J233) TaxID=1318466 RepID=U4KKF3_ALTPJ|nr:hypothetical protein [Alteracholeplasma palmae]CCV64038.1 hypothetical protein BN85404610 [Alteracholeplasma palmae J233]
MVLPIYLNMLIVSSIIFSVIIIAILICIIFYVIALKSIQKSEKRVLEVKTKIDLVLLKKYDIYQKMNDIINKTDLEIEKKDLSAMVDKSLYVACLNDLIEQMLEQQVIKETHNYSSIKEKSIEIQEELICVQKNYNMLVSIYNQKISKFPFIIVSKKKRLVKQEYFELR